MSLHENQEAQARARRGVPRLSTTASASATRFPTSRSCSDVNIDDELTEFDVASRPPRGGFRPASGTATSTCTTRTPLAEVGQAHTPMTMRTRRRRCTSPSTKRRWSTIRHVAAPGRRPAIPRAACRRPPTAARCAARAPFNTPWRTMQIADSAGGLYMSDLILNLNEPNKLGDVELVHAVEVRRHLVGDAPGHADLGDRAQARRHHRRTRSATSISPRAMAFAACWSKAGTSAGTATGSPTATIICTSPADAGLRHRWRSPPTRKRRACSWSATTKPAATSPSTKRSSSAALDLYQRLGVDSIKTGYVADAGGSPSAAASDGRVHLEWHDGQVMSRHHLRVVTEAAKRHIAINAHEPIKDTGLRRTYPNWVAREGARGMEYNAWGDPPNPPEHEANLVFTRMLSGPMDFTPGVDQPGGQASRPCSPRVAKQLALYVVIYSPIQMAADLTEELRARSQAVPVHQGRAGGLGGHARAQWRDRRLRHLRPQGPQQRRTGTSAR